MEALFWRERQLKQQELKKQLYEFIEDIEEPFDAKFLVERAAQPLDEWHVQEILQELEEEGLIISLRCGRWLSTKVLLKRWIKAKNLVYLPADLIELIEKFIRARRDLGYKTVEEFVKDAAERLLRKIRNKLHNH